MNSRTKAVMLAARAERAECKKGRLGEEAGKGLWGWVVGGRGRGPPCPPGPPHSVLCS